MQTPPPPPTHPCRQKHQSIKKHLSRNQYDIVKINLSFRKGKKEMRGDAPTDIRDQQGFILCFEITVTHFRTIRTISYFKALIIRSRCIHVYVADSSCMLPTLVTYMHHICRIIRFINGFINMCKTDFMRRR